MKIGLRRLALLALPLLLAAGTLGTTPAHAATSTKPKVGDCHDLTWKTSSGMSDKRRPVPCSSRHTLQTIGVPTVATALAGLSDDDLSSIALAACAPVWIKVLGRGVTRRATTAYQEFIFVPTPRQIAQGARWVRCDIGLLAAKVMLPLPRRLPHPILSKRVEDETLKCLDSKTWSTPCSRRHAYRPTGVYTFKPMAWPGADWLRSAAAEVCPKGTKTQSWTGPSDWAAGDRALVCYAKTSQ